MIRSRIFYFLLFLPILLCNIFLGGYVFLLALLLFLIFPVLSYMAMQIYSSQLELTFHQKANRCQLGVKSFSFFPLGIIQAKVVLENHFTREIQKQEIWLFTSGSKEININSFFHEEMGHCIIRINSFSYYDMLGLFKKQISCKKKTEFTIYPTFVKTGVSYERSLAEYEADGNVNKFFQGNLEDKHEVREYIPGDKQNRIHHKLSYKLSKIMVREFAAVQQEGVFVFVDVSCTLEECIYVFSYLKDFLISMVNQKQSSFLYWQSAEEIHSLKIESEQDVWKAIQQILQLPKVQQCNLLSSADYMWIVSKNGVVSTKGGERLYAEQKT